MKNFVTKFSGILLMAVMLTAFCGQAHGSVRAEPICVSTMDSDLTAIKLPAPARFFLAQSVEDVYTYVPPAKAPDTGCSLLHNLFHDLWTFLTERPEHLKNVHANGLDAAQIVSDFGKYFIDSGQGRKDMLQMIMQKSFTPSICTKKTTKDTLYRFSVDDLDEVVQGFQTTWTPKGTLTFKPREIQLREIKVDKELLPDQIEESWLGFLTNETDPDRKTWPIVKYLAAEKILARKEKDMEKKVYYQGEYVAPTTGVAGAAKNVLTGFRKLMSDGIADGMVDLSSFVGVLATSTIFEQVEGLAGKILDGNDQLDAEDFVICLNHKWKRAYLQDKRNTHGTDINYDPKKVTIDFMENFTLVGLPSMAGFDDIWATPKSNLIHVMNREKINPLRVENVDRKVKIFGDWWEAVGFGINEYVFTALVDESDDSGS